MGIMIPFLPERQMCNRSTLSDLKAQPDIQLTAAINVIQGDWLGIFIFSFQTAETTKEYLAAGYLEEMPSKNAYLFTTLCTIFHA